MLAADCVVRRAAGDRAARVARDGTAAGVAHAGYRNPVNFEVRCADADYLAAVGRRVAQSDDVFHAGILVLIWRYLFDGPCSVAFCRGGHRSDTPEYVTA